MFMRHNWQPACLTDRAEDQIIQLLCQPNVIPSFARSARTANCVTKSETSLLTTLGRTGVAPSDLRFLISLEVYARRVDSGIPSEVTTSNLDLGHHMLIYHC